MAKSKKTSVRVGRKPRAETGVPRCGLCGNTDNLTKTECCGNWICDDADSYVIFSFARNSCYRNHDRYTLCAAHFHEGHRGDWKTCKKCREMYETEMYVWYGTNEYNFEVLPDPPTYEPTRCTGCKRVIKLADGGYSYSADGYFCWKCTSKRMDNADRRPRRRKSD